MRRAIQALVTSLGLAVVLMAPGAVASEDPTAAVPAGSTELAAKPGGKPKYLNPDAPVDKRVKDLLKRMTLAEKVGQMTQIRLGRLRGDCQWEAGKLKKECMHQVLVESKVGSILSGGGEAPVKNTPKQWAKMVNTIQRYAIENSRLHIPIIYGVDAVHGHNNVRQATMFPHQIGIGATWDREIAKKVGRSTATAVHATGPTWNFSPVADIARDTRWGRYYEAYSEDPYLAGSLAAQAVKGIQHSGKVAATVKHFAGYSEPVNGHDRVPANLPMRYLQDTILPAYKKAIEAGAMTVMVNSGAVNGIPVHTSRYLLTEVLREKWGFEGVVISDWQDMRYLVDRYHVAADYEHAIAMAVNAGVDMAMEPQQDQRFTELLMKAVEDGLVSKKRIDEAAGRVLRLKFRLGLFEHPYVDASKANERVIGADRDLALRAATESMTLLRNSADALPLSPDADKIVVAGPSANSVRRQMGGWTVGWQGIPEGVEVPATTVLEGVRETVSDGTEVVHATSRKQAVGETAGADAAIVVVGEPPGAEGDADREVPALSRQQQELVQSLQETGTPVAVVVMAGRPLVLGQAADAKSLLMAWLPGTMGGTAVANVVFGKANPSGRLPVSWPKTVGDQPMYYQQLPGPHSGDSAGYDPLFGFGHGLSYTTYEVGDVSVVGDGTVGGGDTVTVSVRVANTGERAGEMVVPVYVDQKVSRILTPPRRLVAYTRVALEAGQEKTVELAFPMSRVAVTTGDIGGDGERRVLKGSYQVLAGEKKDSLTVR